MKVETSNPGIMFHHVSQYVATKLANTVYASICMNCLVLTVVMMFVPPCQPICCHQASLYCVCKHLYEMSGTHSSDDVCSTMSANTLPPS